MKTGTLVGLCAVGVGGLIFLASRTDTGKAIKETLLDVSSDVLHTRGYKNNNPLNIIRNRSSSWDGMSPVQSDSQFVQFVDPRYGIRAAKITIENNIAGKVQNPAMTIRQLVSKWTATDKDEPAYIANVSKATGIPPDQKLKREDVFALIKAMIRQEIGGVPYADSLIREGMAIA